VKMRIQDFLRDLAREGEIFTVEDVYRITGIDKAYLRKLLYRLEKRGIIERMERGKYLLIPLHGEKGKYTIHEFVIGSVLVQPYAIAYWSALHHYGLTEQIPRVVFIQTTSWKRKQELDVLGFKFKIVRVVDRKFFGFQREWIEEAQINITEKEKTIVDCLDKPQYCGGIVEVAKALRYRKFSEERLSRYAVRIGNSGVLRRLGYLCDQLGIKVRLPKVDIRNYLYLDPSMPKKGNKNSKWRLIINLDEKVLKDLE